jgi:hypothetical protein
MPPQAVGVAKAVRDNPSLLGGHLIAQLQPPLLTVQVGPERITGPIAASQWRQGDVTRLPPFKQRPLLQKASIILQRQREDTSCICITTAASFLIGAPPMEFTAVVIGAHRQIQELDRPQPQLGEQLQSITPALSLGIRRQCCEKVQYLLIAAERISLLVAGHTPVPTADMALEIGRGKPHIREVLPLNTVYQELGQ